MMLDPRIRLKQSDINEEKYGDPGVHSSSEAKQSELGSRGCIVTLPSENLSLVYHLVM